jgi:chemotaxis signal transduction protein
VVDGVSDVVQLQDHEIKPAPELGSMLGASFLREVAVTDGRMLLLADIGRLLALDELKPARRGLNPRRLGAAGGRRRRIFQNV